MRSALDIAFLWALFFALLDLVWMVATGSRDFDAITIGAGAYLGARSAQGWASDAP